MANTGFKIIEFGVFIQTDSKCIHVATAISKVTFELYTESFCSFIPVLTAGCDKSSHVYDAVFLGTHGHAVCKSEHLFGYFLYTLVFVTFLACFNEIGVFGKTGRVEQNRFVVLVRDISDFAQVLHGNRLPAGCIVGDGNNDEWYVVIMFF